MARVTEHDCLGDSGLFHHEYWDVMVDRAGQATLASEFRDIGFAIVATVNGEIGSARTTQHLRWLARLDRLPDKLNDSLLEVRRVLRPEGRLLMLEHDFIAPSINCNDPDPAIAGAPLVTECISDAGISTAMSNSFGFGGTNSTLVFQKR